MGNALGIKEAALEFMSLVASGKVEEAYQCHIASDFRHHNPYFHGDAGSLKAAMLQNAKDQPEKVIEIKHALQDGNLVAVHSHIRPDPASGGRAAVHLFRFEGTSIAELWDIRQPVPEKSPNSNGMF